MSVKQACCNMHKKVALAIARIIPEEECGVPDSEMVDFHDFTYKSKTDLPVAAALSFRFCPWCGESRNEDDDTRRTTEVVKPRPD